MRGTFLAVCALLGASLLQAQTPVVTKDPQALIRAQRSLAVMGGTAALALVKDSQATGVVTVPALKATFPIVIKTSGTRKTRVEVSRPTGTHIRILNNGQAAIVAPDGKVRRLTTNNTISERVTHIPLLSMLADQAEAEVELVVAKSDGSVASANSFVTQIVRGTNKESADLYRKFSRTTFYADAVSGLISKMVFNNLAENNDLDSAVPVEVVYSDYRSVSGVMVPFKVVTYTDGQLESELALDSIAFNVGIADSEFAIPAEVADAR